MLTKKLARTFTHKSVLCALTGAIWLSGCAGFRANQLGDANKLALRSSAPVKTKVFSRWHMAAGTKGDESALNLLAAMGKKHFEDALRAADCCVLVESLNEADLVVDGAVYNDVDPMAWLPAVITGFSLYTIPSWVTDKVHVAATATKGDTRRAYELKDQMTLVQWLPMLVALPFTGNPFRNASEMNDNLYQHLVLRIKQDGLIP
jgi:hypothetical protein